MFPKYVKKVSNRLFAMPQLVEVDRQKQCIYSLDKNDSCSLINVIFVITFKQVEYVCVATCLRPKHFMDRKLASTSFKHIGVCMKPKNKS